MEVSKNRSRINASTIAIIILSILLIASIAFGATTAYFSAQKDVTGTITLGNPVNVNITQGGASVETLTFDGTAMPGSVYDQKIGVEIPQESSNALLRAKITLTNAGSASQNVEASTDANWQKNNQDDYYYYKGVATAGQKIDFVNTITIPTTLTNDDAKKVYTINVVVEAIQQANYVANSVWEDAPEDWVQSYATAPVI